MFLPIWAVSAFHPTPSLIGIGAYLRNARKYPDMTEATADRH